jgi:hypothetical protein
MVLNTKHFQVTLFKRFYITNNQLSTQSVEFSLNIRQSTLINYWDLKKQNQLNIKALTKGWRSELLFQFKKNNTQIVLHNARVPDPIYREHIITLIEHKRIKQNLISTVAVTFQAGHLGFIKNQKKTFVAADSVLAATFWLLEQHKAAFNPLKIRFIGQSEVTVKYQKQLIKYLTKAEPNAIYSFEEAAKVAFGPTRLKASGRKRFRYHLHNFSSTVRNIQNKVDNS